MPAKAGIHNLALCLIASDTEQRQLRAYPAASPSADPQPYVVGAKPMTQVRIDNIGQTPAYDVGTYSGVFVDDYPHRKIVIPDLSCQEIMRHHDVKSWFFGKTILADEEAVTPITAIDLDRIKNRTASIYHAGRVCCKDIFDESRWTDFCFSWLGKDGALTFREDGDFPATVRVLRHIRKQARSFSTEKQREHGVHGGRQYGASRAGPSSTPRSNPLPFSVNTVLSLFLAAETTCFLWDRRAGAVTDLSRLADAKRRASHEPAAMGAVLPDIAAGSASYRHLIRNSSRAAAIGAICRADNDRPIDLSRWVIGGAFTTRCAWGGLPTKVHAKVSLRVVDKDPAGWSAPMGKCSRRVLHSIGREIPGRGADVQNQFGRTGEAGK